MADLGRHHPLVRRIRRLRRDRAAREADGVFLAEGIHLAQEALAAGAAIERAVVAPAMHDHPEGMPIVRALTREGIPVDRVSEDVLRGMQDARAPQPVVLVVRRARPSVPDPERGPWVIACDVQDPGNLGGIFRTAVAAGASAIAACGNAADPYHPRTVRASAGAVLRCAPAFEPDATALVRAASGRGFAVVVAAADGSVRYDRFDWSRPVAIVLGSEGRGVRREVVELADATLAVPMADGVDSLSVGAAAAIVLFEARRARLFGAARPARGRFSDG